MISDLVHEGLDLLTVARIPGTSVVMIERHYGHLHGEVAATALARLALESCDGSVRYNAVPTIWSLP